MQVIDSQIQSDQEEIGRKFAPNSIRYGGNFFDIDNVEQIWHPETQLNMVLIKLAVDEAAGGRSERRYLQDK